MNSLPPWANGPFELLVHAEGHLIGGEDFDRRIALISFDNAIEVAIMTYLALNPIQRGNRTYPKVDVDKWLNNYHTKLDFLGYELSARSMRWEVDRSYIIWVHDHRNEQYHGGNKGIPEKQVLALIRKAALWIFGVLFDVVDPEQRLARAIAASALPGPPQRIKSFDRAIDREFNMVDIADGSFYVSELLFSVDYAAYREVGARLCETRQHEDPKEEKE